MKHQLQSAFYIVVAIVLSVSQVAAQGYEIKGHLDKFTEDTIYLGYYYGDKQYLIDTTSVVNGDFVFEGDDELRSGVYLVVMPPKNTFFQVLVDGSNANFSFSADHTNLNETITFEGSIDNEIFYENMSYIGAKKKEADALSSAIDSLSSPAEKQATQTKLDGLGKEVIAHQKTLIAKGEGMLSSALIASGITEDMPEFSGTDDEKQMKRYRHFKSKYWDNLDLGDPRMLLTPQNMMFDRVNYYIEKLTPQHPDSIITSLDLLLAKMEPAEETYKFFLIKFVNDYAAPKFVGLDKVFVHLAETYYATGKAPWIDEKQLAKILDEAQKTKPTLIGQQAPDFTVQRRDSSDLSLYGLDNEHTILVFWAHDCGHCKESMPALDEFMKKHQDKDLGVLSVCTKIAKDEGLCWDFVDEKGLDHLTNASDMKGGLSRIHSLYNIKKTPKLFVLDRDKVIVTKGIGVEQLEQFFVSQGVFESE